MIETERLILRRWEDRDRAPLNAMCRDPRVMAHIGPLQDMAETDAAIARQNGFLDRLGYCFWAIERQADGAMLGFCGIKPGAEGTPIQGEVEIGWRLAFDHWGHGYAREAAQASLDWGWNNTPAANIAAITVPGNVRSWGLMERLGMIRAVDGDFVDPAAPADSPIKHAITYSISRPEGR